MNKKTSVSGAMLIDILDVASEMALEKPLSSKLNAFFACMWWICHCRHHFSSDNRIWTFHFMSSPTFHYRCLFSLNTEHGPSRKSISLIHSIEYVDPSKHTPAKSHTFLLSFQFLCSLCFVVFFYLVNLMDLYGEYVLPILNYTKICIQHLSYRAQREQCTFVETQNAEWITTTVKKNHETKITEIHDERWSQFLIYASSTFTLTTLANTPHAFA